MYRTVMEQLQKWKAKKHHKPLVIRGARQVGKTWLMKAFGAAEYESVVYINFDNNERMRNLFEGSLAVERLVTGLELYAGHKIDPANTLLIFDEVQEVPTALTSLKYFNEDAPQYQIICAGSLLGVALHQGTSFPVGKVEFLDRLSPIGTQCGPMGLNAAYGEETRRRIKSFCDGSFYIPMQKNNTVSISMWSFMRIYQRIQL